MDNRRDAVVIGAGVIGLTAGIRLIEAGLRVGIVADKPISETTSANAGAIWGPFLSKLDSRVLDWSFRTFYVLRELAACAGTGVEMVEGRLLATVSEETPPWVGAVDGCAESEETLFAPYVCGWRYRVPIADMPVYLQYLMDRFLTLGGSFQQRRVDTLQEFIGFGGHVIVCSGLGARDLLHDDTLTPSKGQLVVVDNPGITKFFAERGDGPDLTYLLPQGDKVVLGGTAEDTYASAGADLEALNSILERCARVEPKLLDSRRLGHRVGFRPCRPTVRLDHDVTDDGTHLIYNYGHGGSGVSLAWACAEAVTDIAVRCEANAENTL